MNLVRDSINRAPDELSHVNIDRSRVIETALELRNEEFSLPAWRIPVFLDEHNEEVSFEEVINYVYIGNAINFQFRDYQTGDKFRVEYGGDTWSGSFAMWACLKRAYENEIPITRGRYLQSLSRSELCQIFKTNSGPTIPLLGERHRILNEVGDNLVEHFDGSFSTFIRDSENCLYNGRNGILENLVEAFPSFRDTAEIATEKGSERIYFLKQAQLATAVLFGRSEGSSMFEIEDPHEFTIFADYNIPNILRSFGILSYDSSLEELIDSCEVINSGNDLEVEIRIATIRACDHLLSELNKRRKNSIIAPQLDVKLFQLRDSVETKPHKVRSTHY